MAMIEPEFDNSYARLPSVFYSAQEPTPVSSPEMIRTNPVLAEELGFDSAWIESPEAALVFSGNLMLPGMEPISAVYAGHQFGGWNPQLGDGRATLLGELVSRSGHRYDVQLKGSGRTPYSRGGDGRSPIGPVLREYIVSEAMAVLGVPTTRSLAAVTTGDQVVRDTFLPGAILTRVASSHIRIGTFQYFSAQKDLDALEKLSWHCIERHYPEAAKAENPILSFLYAVIASQAELIAKWQSLGFIHGVMNTDNMLICGETIDYGPCAFLDTYIPNKTYSSIDSQGRYAYSNQPRIAHWNLSWLAQALIPLLDENQTKAVELAQQAIDSFPSLYEQLFYLNMRQKLGLGSTKGKSESDSRELIDNLLVLMASEKADFTLTFRSLSEDTETPETGGIDTLQYELSSGFDWWIQTWQAMLLSEGVDTESARMAMREVNPIYIPRNHLVEEVIDMATHQNDFGAFHALLDTLAKPYVLDSKKGKFAVPPRPEQEVRQTFCGT